MMTTTTNFYVGTSGYSYTEWKGSFYPQDLPAKQMLRYYGEKFRTVELNNTFYKMPTAAALEALTKEVPAGFRFAVKAPQRITHFQRLRETNETVAQYIEAADALKERLGPLFFQLPPNFKKDVPRLRDFVALLPKKHRIAFEFRHDSWFADDVFELLREHKIALCIAETEDGVKAPFVSTTDWGYLRLRLPEYRDADLKKWIKRVRGENWRDTFVFFKHEDEGKGPKMAQRFLKLAGD
jgi:uncharacterized protein YecE (DUF72 family)